MTGRGERPDRWHVRLSIPEDTEEGWKLYRLYPIAEYVVNRAAHALMPGMKEEQATRALLKREICEVIRLPCTMVFGGPFDPQRAEITSPDCVEFVEV